MTRSPALASPSHLIWQVEVRHSISTAFALPTNLTSEITGGPSLRSISGAHFGSRGS
jgi:hypothetical protein